jgi:hypothetical protein
MDRFTPIDEVPSQRSSSRFDSAAFLTKPSRRGLLAATMQAQRPWQAVTSAGSGGSGGIGVSATAMCLADRVLHQCIVVAGPYGQPPLVVGLPQLRP